MPTQNRSTRGKNENPRKVKMKVIANHTAMGWAESTKWGVKLPAITHGRVRDDVVKQ